MADEVREEAFDGPVTPEQLEAEEGSKKQLSLSDLKGSRRTRGFQEWQPKGRQPGEGNQGGPAPRRRGGVGAGPT